MANLAVDPQEATLNLRLDVRLKTAFMDAAESKDRAVTPTTLLLLPKPALAQAFDSYPPLRMQLLEEHS